MFENDWLNFAGKLFAVAAAPTLARLCWIPIQFHYIKMSEYSGFMRCTTSWQKILCHVFYVLYIHVYTLAQSPLNSKYLLLCMPQWCNDFCSSDCQLTELISLSAFKSKLREIVAESHHFFCHCFYMVVKLCNFICVWWCLSWPGVHREQSF